MKVTIVIPNYNGKELLKVNLPIVLEHAAGQKIIVVDDASTDGSSEMISAQFPQIEVIKRNKNEGFASAVNDGVRMANNELIFLLNHDAVPEKDFLKYLLSHFQDPKVFAVGCLERSIEEKAVVLRGRGIGSFKKGFLIHQRGETEMTDTLWVSGGSGMFRKAIWEKLGGFNRLYNPFYWEDIDLSYRAMKSGYKIMFEPRSIVVHKHHQGVIRKNFSLEEIKKIAYRNQILFVWLNITDVNYLLEHLLYLPLNIINTILTNDKAFISGFIEAWKLLPQAFKNREQNRKNFLLKDREILKNFAC